MSIKTDVATLVTLLDPPADIPPAEARQMIEEHISPRQQRVLRKQLERLTKLDLRLARQKGPIWLTSHEGQDWLERTAI
jgi:hypothetical protein